MTRRLIPASLYGLLIVACGTAPTADTPVTRISQPAPGLQMTARLDHSRLQTGALDLQLVLKNTGTSPVTLPGGYCRVTPITSIQDSNGRVVWSQPVPMLECANPPPDMVQSIAPGEQRTGSYCWRLSSGAGDTSCSPLTLPSGVYRVTGSFYDYPIPALEFQIAR
jgi:hypothetical protein